MEAAQKEIAKKATDMKDLFAKIQENDGLTFVVKVNDEGHLYAKIDENDIAKQIHEEYKIDVPSHLFKLKKKIAEVGSYKVAFLYKDMKVINKTNVKNQSYHIDIICFIKEFVLLNKYI